MNVEKRFEDARGVLRETTPLATPSGPFLLPPDKTRRRAGCPPSELGGASGSPCRIPRVVHGLEEGGQAHKRLGLIGWHANLSEQIKASASAQKIPHLEAMEVYCGKIQPFGHRPPHYPPTNQIMSVVAAALAPARRRDPWFRSCWFAITKSAQSWHSIISSSGASSSSSSYRTLRHMTHVAS